MIVQALRKWISRVPRWAWLLGLFSAITFAPPCAPHQIVVFSGTREDIPEVRISLANSRERLILWQGPLKRSGAQRLDFAAPPFGEAHYVVTVRETNGAIREGVFSYIDGNLLADFTAVVIGEQEMLPLRDMNKANHPYIRPIVAVFDLLNDPAAVGRCFLRGK